MIEDDDLSHTPTGKQTVEQIMQHEKSAAGIVCQMKYRDTHSDPTSLDNDVLGVVATLGKVNDDKLSRLANINQFFGSATSLKWFKFSLIYNFLWRLGFYQSTLG